MGCILAKGRVVWGKLLVTAVSCGPWELKRGAFSLKPPLLRHSWTCPRTHSQAAPREAPTLTCCGACGRLCCACVRLDEHGGQASPHRLGLALGFWGPLTSPPEARGVVRAAGPVPWGWALPPARTQDPRAPDGPRLQARWNHPSDTLGAHPHLPDQARVLSEALPGAEGSPWREPRLRAPAGGFVPSPHWLLGPYHCLPGAPVRPARLDRERPAPGGRWGEVWLLTPGSRSFQGSFRQPGSSRGGGGTWHQRPG